MLPFAENGWSAARHSFLDELRDEGSKRTYVFFLNEVQIGKLESKYDGKSKFEGISCHKFSQNLNLDYSPLGREYALEIKNKHYVDSLGHYVGDDMTLKANNQTQRLYLINRQGSLNGFFTRGDEKQDVNLSLGDRFFAVDNNMIDQYEVLLSFKDISIGDTIVDTIFVPQTLNKTLVKIVVESYGLVRYGRLYDSAYVCHFIEPTDMIVYFTRDKKIIKAEQGHQNLQIVLIESPLDKLAPKIKPLTFADFFKRIPVYLVYLIFGLIFVSPFIRKYYRKPEIYMILILGGALFPILSITQFPLQRWYSSQFFIPGVEAGGSLYFYAVFSTLIAGFIQETLRLFPIALFFLWKKPRQMFSITLGVFCGIGFGICEACSLTGAAYQSGAMNVVSWGIFERIFAILFHATAGAAMGYGINRGLKHLSIIWLILIVIHSLSNYLVVFFQKAIIDVALLEIMIGLIDLLLVLGVYLTIKGARRPRMQSKRKR